MYLIRLLYCPLTTTSRQSSAFMEYNQNCEKDIKTQDSGAWNVKRRHVGTSSDLVCKKSTLFVVSVPVLSLQIVVADPIVSQAARWRTCKASIITTEKYFELLNMPQKIDYHEKINIQYKLRLITIHLSLNKVHTSDLSAIIFRIEYANLVNETHCQKIKNLICKSRSQYLQTNICIN